MAGHNCHARFTVAGPERVKDLQVPRKLKFRIGCGMWGMGLLYRKQAAPHQTDDGRRPPGSIRHQPSRARRRDHPQRLGQSGKAWGLESMDSVCTGPLAVSMQCLKRMDVHFSALMCKMKVLTTPRATFLFRSRPRRAGVPCSSCGTRDNDSESRFRAVQCYDDPTNDCGSGSDTK